MAHARNGRESGRLTDEDLKRMRQEIAEMGMQSPMDVNKAANRRHPPVSMSRMDKGIYADTMRGYNAAEQGRRTSRDAAEQDVTRMLDSILGSSRRRAERGEMTQADVGHWQARMEDRPIEEGISAMQESGRMTEGDRNYWLGEEKAPLDTAITDSLGRMTDVDREYWLEQMKKGRK